MEDRTTASEVRDRSRGRRRGRETEAEMERQPARERRSRRAGGEWVGADKVKLWRINLSWVCFRAGVGWGTGPLLSDGSGSSQQYPDALSAVSRSHTQRHTFKNIKITSWPENTHTQTHEFLTCTSSLFIRTVWIFFHLYSKRNALIKEPTLYLLIFLLLMRLGAILFPSSFQWPTYTVRLWPSSSTIQTCCVNDVHVCRWIIKSVSVAS